MVPFSYILIALAFTSIEAKPSETTHELLEKLGFEKMNKPQVNHHKKRLASETNKARYSIDDYNTETDSHMFLVKLPPHSPYYSQSTAEKIDHNTVTKPPIHFRTNGKPLKVYHWNIPVLKKMADNKYRTKTRNDVGDSKIYNLKIHHGEKSHYFYPDSKVKLQKHKKRNDLSMKNLRKHEESQDYLRNVLNDMSASEPKKRRKDDMKPKHEHIMSIKELAENGYEHIQKEKHQNEVVDTDITNIIMSHKKKGSEKKKYKADTPSVYHPAIPKQNSFYKYFPGNGKPKSFYVIEKSKTPSRYHRVL